MNGIIGKQTQDYVWTNKGSYNSGSLHEDRIDRFMKSMKDITFLVSPNDQTEKSSLSIH